MRIAYNIPEYYITYSFEIYVSDILEICVMYVKIFLRYMATLDIYLSYVSCL